MIINRTVNNPVSWEPLYFCFENKTLYTSKEIREQFWTSILQILELKETVTVNTPLLIKHKKNDRRNTR